MASPSDQQHNGKDIAEVLGYEKARNAIATHVDAEDALKQGVLTEGGTQEMTVINESGLKSRFVHA